MNKKAGFLFVLSLVASLVFTGCGKKEPDNAKAESAQAVESEQKKSDRLPNISKPDLSTPSSAYREMKYAADSLYAYYAIYPKETNFGEIVIALSKKYGTEVDGFKKQDIVASLKDEMEDGLKKAKDNKYYFMNVKATQMDIQPYNFEKKSLFNPGLGINLDTYRSYAVPTFSFPNVYGDGNSVGAAVRFSNVKQFADVKVEDQEVARKMEGLRGAGKLGMNVYFYANDLLADRDDYQELIPQITKVEYLDPAGNVLFTQIK